MELWELIILTRTNRPFLSFLQPSVSSLSSGLVTSVSARETFQYLNRTFFIPTTKSFVTCESSSSNYRPSSSNWRFYSEYAVQSQLQDLLVLFPVTKVESGHSSHQDEEDGQEGGHHPEDGAGLALLPAGMTHGLTH